MDISVCNPYREFFVVAMCPTETMSVTGQWYRDDWVRTTASPEAGGRQEARAGMLGFVLGSFSVTSDEISNTCPPIHKIKHYSCAQSRCCPQAYPPRDNHYKWAQIIVSI